MGVKSEENLGSFGFHALRHAWELSVLSRAISYPNLSAAAVHVGLSQPQLSRIIKKLETALEVQLLSREVRRNSSWTPIAQSLARAFKRSSRALDDEILKLAGETEPRELRAGTLEGLMGLAAQCARGALEKSNVRVLHLDVYDLDELEELFLRGDLDWILTSREPARRKFTYYRKLGYQRLAYRGKPSATWVMSNFEFGSGLAPPAADGRPGTIAVGADVRQRILVSNSLTLRRHWLETYEGYGSMPADEIEKTAPSGAGVGRVEPVHLIGAEDLSKRLWDLLRPLKQ